MKQYLKIFRPRPEIDYKVEVLAGLTVALALIPEAVAFSLIAGVPPLVGLYAAFVLGMVTANFWREAWHDLRCHRSHCGYYR